MRPRCEESFSLRALHQLLLQLQKCFRVRNTLKDLIHFLDKLVELCQVLKEPFWDQDTTVVVALNAALANGVANTRDDFLQ